MKKKDGDQDPQWKLCHENCPRCEEAIDKEERLPHEQGACYFVRDHPSKHRCFMCSHQW